MSNIKHQSEIDKENLVSNIIDNYASYYSYMRKAIDSIYYDDEGTLCKREGYDVAINKAHAYLSEVCKLSKQFRELVSDKRDGQI